MIEFMLDSANLEAIAQCVEAQVTDAINAGAHGVTVTENILYDAFGLGIIQTAVEDFRSDWIAMHGDISISDL